MDAHRVAETGGKVSAPYGTLIFSLVCFTCVAASGIFRLASATAQGSPNAFPENNSGYLVVIGTAIWAARVWSRVTHVEPETDSAFRQKHRAFGLKAGSAIAVVLISAATVGTYAGFRAGHQASLRAGHQARLDMLTKQVDALAVRTMPTKQRIIQLETRDTQNLPEYLQRCTDLEAAINDYEPALQQMDSLMSQTQQELQELKTNAGFASLLTSETVLRSVLSKDLEAARAYRKEIGYAKQLPGLPESERLRFYYANIQPVVDEEGRIAKDAIEILKAAEARGVMLPQAILKELRNR